MEKGMKDNGYRVIDFPIHLLLSPLRRRVPPRQAVESKTIMMISNHRDLLLESGAFHLNNLVFVTFRHMARPASRPPRAII